MTTQIPDRDPSSSFTRNRISLSLFAILLIGTTLSIYRFSSVQERDQQELSKEFRLRSSNYASSFTKQMDGYLAALNSLAEFVELEPDLDRSKFEAFTGREIQTHPGILCLEWLPRVSNSGRLAYERRLSQAEGRAVSIMSGTSASHRPAPVKADYFPITLMFPRTAASSVIGIDGYAQESLRTALDHSRDTGEPVSAAKFRVFEPTTDGFSVPLYLPVYRKLGANPSAPERRVTLAGYVLAIIELNTAFETAIQQIAAADIDLQFYDLSAAPGNRLLHFHPATSQKSSARPLDERDALNVAPLKFIQQLRFASRQWAIVCTPAPHYLEAHRDWQPWAVLAFSLFTTCSLTFYLVLHFAHKARAEDLVGQLFHNNARLNREIAVRTRAEQEISRLNTSLEARVAERTEALRESEERYALAARGSKDGLWDWNISAGSIYFSPRWKNMLGYTEQEISSDPSEWFNRMHPEEAAGVRAQINSHCEGSTPHFQSEHRMLHKDGSYRWMLSRGVAVRDDYGHATRLAGSQTDITEDKVADPLTGLPNRLFLAEKLQQAIERARESRSHLFAILFLDIDRFKVVNDSLGHKTGDLLLKEIASRLRACGNSVTGRSLNLVVARLGGDEFAVLLDGIASPAVATDFAALIKSTMKPAFELAGRQLFASFSIGVALGGPDSEPGELLRDADTAMYHAKAQGKQRYEVFDSALRQRAMDRMQLESDLRAAVPRGELVVHYQPKISLVTGDTVEFEALVRWNHPVRGVLFPQSFVPLADETGIILPIGEWVLFQACRQLSDWRSRFSREVGISVNISARQFETSELVSQVRSILAETNLPASSLSLEVTESLLLENPESAIRQLTELREIGIGLKIDDFGTGFSSLSYLHRLPFSELKIDRSFISSFGKKPETTHIVQTIILLARLLNMKVVAEGVETEDQLRQLTALNCDFAQGNFFSKPLPPVQAEIFLSSGCHPFFSSAESGGFLQIQ